MDKAINRLTIVAAIASILAVALVLSGCEQQESGGEVDIIGREVQFPDGSKVKCATAVGPENVEKDDFSGVTCDWGSNDR